MRKKEKRKIIKLLIIAIIISAVIILGYLDPKIQNQINNLIKVEETQANEDGEIWTVVGSGTNVRDGASSSSNVVFALPGGTEVEVVEYGEDWSKVLIDGKTYYIYSPLLTR